MLVECGITKVPLRQRLAARPSRRLKLFLMAFLPLFECLQILLNLGIYRFSFERAEINQPGEVLASYSSSFVEEHQQTLRPACTKRETIYNSTHLKTTFTKICLETFPTSSVIKGFNILLK